MSELPQGAVEPIMRERGLYILHGASVDIEELMAVRPGQIILAHPQDVTRTPAREWYEPIGDEE